MSLCPCGSGLELDACCGQYIEGKAKAPTAEALMRARYTAHCLGKYQFLTDTTHPEFREDASADEIKEWSSMMTWEGLDIIETVEGGENDSTGEVKFCAHYSVQNVPQELREDAFFRKEGDEWFYVEGNVAATTPAPVAAARSTRSAACPDRLSGMAFPAKDGERTCVSEQNPVQGMFGSSSVPAQGLKARRGFADRAKRMAGGACHFPLFVAGFQSRRNVILFPFLYVCESAPQRRQIPHSPNMSKEDAHG